MNQRHSDSQDTALIELCRPDTSAGRRKVRAEAVGLCLRNSTTGRRVDTRRAVRANRLAELLDVGGLRAACRGMQRHLVVAHQVDALDNVNLAAGRPVGALGPEPRPYLTEGSQKKRTFC